MSLKSPLGCITRVWRGWTTKANADAYVKLLQTKVFPDIHQHSDKGLIDINFHRRDIATEDTVEFLTIMRFENMDAINRWRGNSYDFTNPDDQAAQVPQEARELLKDYDQYAKHFVNVYHHSDPFPSSTNYDAKK